MLTQVCDSPRPTPGKTPTVRFDTFRTMLEQLRLENGALFELDAALDRIATLLGVGDAQTLLRAVGKKGRSYVQELRAQSTVTPKDATTGRPITLPPSTPKVDASSHSGSPAFVLPTAEPPVIADFEEPASLDPPDAATEARGRASRKGALDGLTRWPPKEVSIPPLRDNTDDLVEVARAVAQNKETELRRIAQLGRADTAAWHPLSFTGNTLITERLYVLQNVLKDWGPLGDELQEPIKRFWNGERDDSALTSGLTEGTRFIMRLLLHVMALMETKIARAKDRDLFSMISSNVTSNVAIWGVEPYRAVSAGETVSIKWQFFRRVLGKTVSLDGPAPSHVNIGLYRGNLGEMTKMCDLTERATNTGSFSFTVPADSFEEEKIHFVVFDSSNRASKGVSAPFTITGKSREGLPVKGSDARPGLHVTRGPDWRFAEQDGGPGSRGVITEVGLFGIVRVRWEGGDTHEYLCGSITNEHHLAHAGPEPPDVGVSYRGIVFGGSDLSGEDRSRMAEEMHNASDNVGADEAFLKSLPMARLTVAQAGELSAEQCTVCMGPYEEGEKVVTTPCKPKGHIYHEACLKKWLAHSTKCPVCNHDFPCAVHASVLRPSAMTLPRRRAPQEVDPFKLEMPDGDNWICPECVGLRGVPVEVRHSDRNGCGRCGISRHPWQIIKEREEVFQSMAQVIVDTVGLAQLSEDEEMSEDPNVVRRVESGKKDLLRAEEPLRIRRERIMGIATPWFESRGWKIADAVQLMLAGEQNEAPIVKSVPDPRSAVMVRHILRLVSDPHRLDRSRQAAKPTPQDEVRANHFYQRYEVVFKGMISALKNRDGPINADAAGTSGLLAFFETMGWEIGPGIVRMLRGRFDLKEHSRAVDVQSKVVLHHISELIKAPVSVSTVDEVEFYTTITHSLLDQVCDRESAKMTDADLVEFLSTWRDIATDIRRGNTENVQKAIVSRGSPLWKQMGKWMHGKLALFLLGFETSLDCDVLTLARPPSTNALKVIIDSISTAEEVIRGNAAAPAASLQTQNTRAALLQLLAAAAASGAMSGGRDSSDDDDETPGGCATQ